MVYNAVTRDAGRGRDGDDARGGLDRSPLPASCFDDPAQQGQVTLASGFYKFDVNFSDPACPSGGAYLIARDAAGRRAFAGVSQLIPPTSDPSTPPFDVPDVPGHAG